MQTATTANGPERRTDWDAVDWRRAHRNVRNLRQRIFRATRAGDTKRVRSLQKLMLRSYSNILLSVRRVTQTNAGKNTPGVDKIVVKTPRARGELVDHLATFQPWRSRPVRRVYIPKPNGSKQRPLGIPTIMDRCLQARVKNALEPEWEARFEGSSYGFRPGRGCQDAIAKIYLICRPHKRKKWILDTDIKGAFDNIDHDFLLQSIGQAPGRELVRQWLKAGIMEDGVFHETPTGTPQGGVISPLLLNIALHGMETALGVKLNTKGEIKGKRAVVRYADDEVVCCESQKDAVCVKEDFSAWLVERGLALSEEKTRIVHLTDGFDFLGFNVRQFHRPEITRTGYKLLIRPSKKAVNALRQKLREAWLELRGHSLQAVLFRLNPIIRGWANYYRTVVSSRTFHALDQWMYLRSIRYARHTHPNKSRKWLKKRYWGQLNPERDDQWVFGNKRPDKRGRFHYLLKFSWFKIVRHQLVKGTSSPDDASLREYWWSRRKVNLRHLSASDVDLANDQDWVCPVCGEELLNGEQLERHHLIAKADGGSDGRSNRVLVHLFCHQQETAAWRKRRRMSGKEP